MKQWMVTAVLCLGIISGKAADLEGKVIEQATGAIVEYASVALYLESDSSLVTGTLTDKEGKFRISKIKEGHYYLVVSFMGFENASVSNIHIKTPGQKLTLPEMGLSVSATQLEAVEVVADELEIEYKIDRKIINASKQLTSISGTAVDILENIPSITVDIDGSVALRGSTGFMVLIDGRPTVMEASDALRSVPANMIENIEIITNPSAKYNPDGATGMINIVTKKNLLQGVSGIVNVNAGNFGRFGAGGLISYSNKKLTLFLSADHNQRNRKRYNFDRRITTSDGTAYFNESSGDENSERLSSIVRGGLGYQITPTNLFNLEFNIGRFKRSSNSELDFIEGIAPQSVENRYTSYYDQFRGGDFYAINTAFTHDFKNKGQNLEFQVQFRNRDSDERSTNEMYDGNNEQSSGQINTETGPGWVLQTNVDYVMPIGDSSRFETGYQSRISRGNDLTGLWWYDPLTQDYEYQAQYSTDTDYNRDIHAMYAIYGTQNGAWGYQLGLRGEYTKRIINNSNDANAKFVLDRFDFFPSAHVSHKMKHDQQIIVSYSRRIERTRGWYLEPFITWVDAFNVRQGNPDIKPVYIDAMELNYLKGLGEHSLSIETYYRIAKNKVEHIRSVYQDNVIMRQPQNVGTDYSLGAEMALNLNLFPWWKVNLSGNLYHYKLTGTIEDEVLDRSSLNWNSRLRNTFIFFKGSRMQLNSRYNSATVTAQGTRGDYWTADLAWSQEFNKKRMTATVQARDIFGKVERDYSSSGTDFAQSGYQFNYAPQFSVTLNYKFNNYKQKKGNNNVEGDDF